eukprot:jgi/Tetstr1/461668/TSEL_006768.t1
MAGNQAGDGGRAGAGNSSRAGQQLEAALHQRWVESGEKARLKALLREKLLQCGWADELAGRCGAILRERAGETVSAAELQAEIAPLGRAKVPDSVKAELLREIRSFILSQSTLPHCSPESPPAQASRARRRAPPTRWGMSTWQAPPLEFNSTGVRCLTYDDASQSLAVVKNDECLLYTLLTSKQPELGGGRMPIETGEPQTIPLTEGEVLAVRPSPSLPLVGVLRSSSFIEFIDRNSGNSFIQGSRKSKAGVPLLGFFWVQTSFASCCMVTPQGLELYLLSSNHTALTYVKTLSHQVRWYQYTHESRMVLLGTGDRGVIISAYQFTAKEVITLPHFELTPYAAPGAPKPWLESNQVRLLTLYGRVYCCHMDPDGARLSLYRFYKDAVILQHEVELIGGPVELNGYDNLLLVHHLETGVVLIVDVGQGGRHLTPIAGPLPLALHMPPGWEGAAGEGSSSGSDGNGGGSTIAGMLPAYEVYAAGWQFHSPSIAIDLHNGLLWRLEVFLEGVAATCSAWPQLAAFLQRRRPSLHPLSPPKPLVLGILASLLQEREPMAVLSAVYDALNAASAVHMRTAAPAAGQQAALRGPVDSGAVEPAEVTQEVLRWLHEEEAVDAAYLTAAVVEYIASVEGAGLQIPPALFCLAVDCMLEQGQVAQVFSLVEWQPACSSKPLADHLEALATSGRLPGGFELAGAVLCRIGEHEQHCRSLLARGRVLQALRHCQKHRVASLTPKMFLDAAVELQDTPTFVAVYRFCQEHIPDNFQAYAELYARFLDGGNMGKAPMPRMEDLASGSV